MSNGDSIVVILGPSLEAVSGISTHIAQLLSSDAAKTHRFSHFQVGSEGRRESVLRRILRIAADPMRLAGVLLRNRRCIVHINTSMEQKSFWRDLAFLWVSKLLRHKVVYQVHGGYLPQEFFHGRILRWLWRLVLHCPDVVVLLTRHECDAYLQVVPRLKVVCIPNGIDTSALATQTVPREARKSTDPLRLLYMGRLIKDKGIFEIVEAVRLLKLSGSNVTLRMAGVGPDQQQLCNAITSAELNDRIVMLGPVHGDDKAKTWCSADVFLLPTYYREGLPYAVLESLASGCVPIVSPVGGIPDVINNLEHGVFVKAKNPHKLAEAIGGLDKDRAALQRMAAAGIRRVTTAYSVDRFASAFTQLYVELYQREQTNIRG